MGTGMASRRIGRQRPRNSVPSTPRVSIRPAPLPSDRAMDLPNASSIVSERLDRLRVRAGVERVRARRSSSSSRRTRFLIRPGG